MPLRRHIVSIVLAAAVLGLALPIDAIADFRTGLMLSFVVVWIVVWIVYSLVRLLAGTAPQLERRMRLAIWIATLAIVAGLLQIRDVRARAQAEAVVAAAAEHRKRAGSYPRTLAEVGIDVRESRRRYGLGYSVQLDGKAFLVYSQPSMPLVGHRYDFQTARWERLD